MSESTSLKIAKQTGPKSLDELQRKGPPTREEVEAIEQKYGLGVALTEAESDALLEYYTRRQSAHDLPTILSVLYPNCEWMIQGVGQGDSPDRPGATAYENLVWDEDNPLPKPTLAELEKFTPFVQDILDQQEYIRQRKLAYPGEGALIRALWEYVVEGDDEHLNALQARRIAVKKRFPKPENKHWMVQSEDYLRILPNTPADILRQIDEKEMKDLAFRPGVQGADAESLIASGTLEAKAQELIEKRNAQLIEQDHNIQTQIMQDTTPQPTLADIEAFKAAGTSTDSTTEE